MVTLFCKSSIKLSTFRCFGTSAMVMKSPIVTTKYGKLQGASDTLFDGSTYFSFMGIPYAQPPVGKLRFKAPLPLKAWSGVYDATKHGPICPQFDMQTLQIHEGDENCLFLNIYTRSLQSDSKTPIMVFIHGGGFMSGSGNSDMYGPKFLIQHNVILVTINYRLGALGFLCLDTPEVPGNAGMKDQVAALQWVQKNIAQFGGDPQNVTVFGESAGAASVTYHLLSPMSRGLFQKAIAQSGACLTDWAGDTDGKARAYRMGSLLGKDTNDVEELLEFLQSVPAVKLAALSMKTASKYEKHRGLPIHLAPVVEKKFESNVAFLEETPLDLLKSGKVRQVPLIIGYNSSEGLLMTGRLLKKHDFFNKYPTYFVPKEIVDRISEDTLKEFGNRILEFYCKDRGLASDDVDVMADIQSDLHFVCSVHRFATLFAGVCKNIFMYRFNCVTELNFMKNLLNLTNYKGACHVDELFYIFNNVMNTDSYQDKQELRVLVNRMTRLWTDFAKTGYPTNESKDVDWTQYTVAGKEFLALEPQLSMGSHADRERMEFWTKLYDEAGLPLAVRSRL